MCIGYLLFNYNMGAGGWGLGAVVMNDDLSFSFSSFFLIIIHYGYGASTGIVSSATKCLQKLTKGFFFSIIFFIGSILQVCVLFS